MASKWTIIIAIVIAAIIILYFTGKKSVHHEIMIQAKPEKVWQVITTTDQYNEWNPTMLVLEGKLEEGNKVKYRFTQDENNQSEIPATVKKIVPHQLLNQYGGIPLILSYDHTYSLQEENGVTKVIIHEDYRGIGVNFWNPKPVQDAYARLNQALKKRVESLN